MEQKKNLKQWLKEKLMPKKSKKSTEGSAQCGKVKYIEFFKSFQNKNKLLL